jgi:hypothetical protein
MNDPATNVVRLVDVAPGFASKSEADMVLWGTSWLEALGSERYEPLKSLVIVAETKSGQLCVISQSVGGTIDRSRLVGPLVCAANWKAEGLCSPESIEVEG